MRSWIPLLLVGCSWLAAPLGRTATFQVNSPIDAVDANPGNGICETATVGQCTLRAAIMEANALVGADTVQLGRDTYTLSLGPAGDDAGASGDLDILDDLFLVGVPHDYNQPSLPKSVIDGDDLDRVIQVQALLDASDVVVRNGLGGIYVTWGELVMTNCMLYGNDAAHGGGIMQLGGSVTLRETTLWGNTASVYGGGILSSILGQISLTNVTISGNTAGQKGGGIHVEAATADLLNTTIANNQSPAGAGVHSFGIINATNTIVADNIGLDCYHQLGGTPILTGGHNIDSDDTCGFNDPSDFPATDPMLEPLFYYGGSTLTQRPDPDDSIALENGDNSACPSIDQRGVPRGGLFTGDCDIGAVEITALDGPGCH